MTVDSQGRGVGIALLCDSRGMVLEVIYDGLGIAHSITPGRSCAQVVDEANVQKAHNFLAELQSQRAASGWELNVPIGGEVSILCFAGMAQGEHLLIVAGRTEQGASQLFEAFVGIGSEHADALRGALQENAQLARARVERDSALYDELSRLNNELVTLQRQLAKKNAELAKLNELKNRFLGMAAHDLRSPLGSILAFSEFLLDEASEVLSAEHVRFLSIIRSSSKFMRQLVDDFLDVSIIESGRLRLVREPVDLTALVEHNLALNRPMAEKKRIRLSFQPGEPLPMMMLDAAKIEQVLNNLISNAVKYSYPDSTVEIRVTKREDEATPLTELPGGSSTSAIIAVRDQGQGIPTDKVDKLFQMFGKITIRSTGGEKSSGLGLAIAKRIVEEHHGKMWVESQLGEGTTFYISLPIHTCADG